jgi:multiple sugar transport system ATP-binding protein
MAAIALANVSKSFPGQVHAVRDLDLHVRDGELLALVGPSGCGKTTTLRLIAGLERPDRGEIRIGERVVNRVRPSRRNIAMIFQDFALYPHLTVRKGLAHVMRLRRMPRAEVSKRLEWAVQLTGIRELLDRRPGEMSGGQRQRVAFAAALVRNPACHLMDEPLSNLDVAARRRLRLELRRLHRDSGATIIHVTHDQAEAMSLGDRVAVMHEGRIRQVGEPLEVHRNPADRIVAAFMGDPPMNFLEGHLQTENGAVVFRDGHGIELPPPPTLAGQLGHPRLREVVYGFRPGAVRLRGPGDHGGGAGGPGGAMSMRGEVKDIEPAGDHLDMHILTPGKAVLVARIAVGPCHHSPGPRIGDIVDLEVDLAAARLFEPGTAGKRISNGEEAAGDGPRLLSVAGTVES